MGSAEANRINGLKGGRPPLSGQKLELRELCKRLTPKCLDRLEHLAFRGEMESTRHNALALILAYGHGKPTQVVTGPDGGAAVVLQVLCNVNTPDDYGKDWAEPKTIEAKPEQPKIP